MRYPDAIEVRCSGEWVSLEGANESWKSGDLLLTFHWDSDALSLFISAPQRELELIKCSWKQTTSITSKFLTDQWERSYGDLSWQSPTLTRRSPWYILLSDGQLTQAFGVKTGCNSFCSWQVSPDAFELHLDTTSGARGVLLGNRSLHVADIITTENLPGENPYHTDIRFCKMMCPSPKLPAEPIYGINDWYFAYGQNSRDLILQTTRLMADQVTNWDNPPFSVIDMGWSIKPVKAPEALCWGDDFTKGNDKFGEMSQVAEDIKKLGMRPGLWTRPLLANANDKPSSLIPLREGQNDPKERYLDPTIPENLQQISERIRLYKTWGFHLVKHDYTSFDFFGKWGFEMADSLTAPGWHFSDRSITNAEIILFLYRTIRAASLDMYLIGCNTFSHLSAGIFEINRIGDDTSGNEWARTVKMGVNTLGFRLPQHNTFYAADGDCVGLTTKIPWEKNKQWMQLLAESSAPLFISAQPEALGNEQKQTIKRSFTSASRKQPLGEPVDWMSNPRPEEWILNGDRVHFDWG